MRDGVCNVRNSWWHSDTTMRFPVHGMYVFICMYTTVYMFVVKRNVPLTPGQQRFAVEQTVLCMMIRTSGTRGGPTTGSCSPDKVSPLHMGGYR